MKKGNDKKKKVATKKNTLERRQVLLIVVMVIVTALICFGFAFTWLLMNRKAESEIHNGMVEISMENTEGSSLVIEDAFPRTEVGGLSTDPYRFSLRNIGDYEVSYSLVLLEDENAVQACMDENDGECKTVTVNSLRYSLKKNGEQFTSGLLKDSQGVIDMGVLKPAEESETNVAQYELKIWVDYDTKEETEGAKFFGKVDVRLATTE